MIIFTIIISVLSFYIVRREYKGYKILKDKLNRYENKL